MGANRGRKFMNGIADARAWADKLIRHESRGHGDMENAMHRLENRYGIPWRVFWSLKYRPPSDVFVGVYLQLKAAHDAECERQERLLRHEREINKAKAAAFEALAGASVHEDKQQDVA